MLTVSANVNTALRRTKLHRTAVLWDLLREDGVTKYFTTHNAQITYGGNDYEPAGSFSPSAQEHQVGVERPDNLEVDGTINSAAITEADLRAGRYRNARVTETVVDWRYPWAGPFSTYVFWIRDVAFSHTGWKGSLGGILTFLRMKAGRTYRRRCDFTVGDPIVNGRGCGVDLGPFTDTGTVTSVDSIRRQFRASAMGTQVDNYYRHGELTWTGGDNLDLTIEVQKYTDTGRIFNIHLDMPFDIVVGDTFSVHAGCDQFVDTCITKFDNVDNFGGFPWLPGTDRTMQTPNPSEQ